DGSASHVRTAPAGSAAGLGDTGIGASPGSAHPPGTYDFADFVSTFHGTDYLDGTTLYLQTRYGEVRAGFGGGHVTVAYDTGEPPPAIRRRPGRHTEQPSAPESSTGSRRRSPIAVGEHTAAVFWDKVAKLPAGSIHLVKVVLP